MNELIIDKKKYVLLPRKEYEALRKKAALNIKPEKLLSVAEARSLTKELIQKWSKEK